MDNCKFKKLFMINVNSLTGSNNFFKTIFSKSFFSLLIPPFLKGVTGTPVGDFKIPPLEDSGLPLKKGELMQRGLKSPFLKGEERSSARLFQSESVRTKEWTAPVRSTRRGRDFLVYAFSFFILLCLPLPPALLPEEGSVFGGWWERGGVGGGGGVLNPPFLKDENVTGLTDKWTILMAGGFNFSLLNPFYPLKAHASVVGASNSSLNLQKGSPR